MKDCIFCKIGRHEAPADVVHEDNDIIMITPLNPVTFGHVLAIPKVHVVDAFDDIRWTTMTLSHALKFIKSSFNFNIITSVGPHATQTVFHLHWHFIPRHEGDGLMLPWTNQKKALHD